MWVRLSFFFCLWAIGAEPLSFDATVSEYYRTDIKANRSLHGLRKDREKIEELSQTLAKLKDPRTRLCELPELNSRSKKLVKNLRQRPPSYRLPEDPNSALVRAERRNAEEVLDSFCLKDIQFSLALHEKFPRDASFFKEYFQADPGYRNDFSEDRDGTFHYAFRQSFVSRQIGEQLKRQGADPSEFGGSVGAAKVAAFCKGLAEGKEKSACEKILGEIKRGELKLAPPLGRTAQETEAKQAVKNEREAYFSAAENRAFARECEKTVDKDEWSHQSHTWTSGCFYTVLSACLDERKIAHRISEILDEGAFSYVPESPSEILVAFHDGLLSSGRDLAGGALPKIHEPEKRK